MNIQPTCYVCKASIENAPVNPRRRVKIDYCSEKCRQLFKKFLLSKEQEDLDKCSVVNQEEKHFFKGNLK